MEPSLMSSTGMKAEEFTEWLGKVRFVRAEAVRMPGASSSWGKTVSPKHVLQMIWPRAWIEAGGETERISLKACKGNKDREQEEISSAVMRLIRRASGHDVRLHPRIWDASRSMLGKVTEDVQDRIRRSMRRAAKRKDLTKRVRKDLSSLRRTQARNRLMAVMREVRTDIRTQDVTEAWKMVCNEALVQRVMAS